MKKPSSPKFTVSDMNLKKAAMRLLGQKLVSTEVQYVQNKLGATATQEELDASVLAVRKMPWAKIVVPE